MSALTTIEWTDATWNPVGGCTKVSPGCDNCYAERIAERFAGSKAWPDGFQVTLRPHLLNRPLTWREPRRVFVNSMSDLFHDDVPDDYIVQVFDTMQNASRHTFQLLTKRHARMRSFTARYLSGGFATRPLAEAPLAATVERPPRNVWLGVSVESQQWAAIRIPALVATPAAVHFLSCEPLLSRLDLGDWLDQLDWVIVGGESGPGARPVKAEWVRDLRDQCSDAGVPFFFKQWGGLTPKSNGRDLDGRTWSEYPEAAA